jgi:hypothetical protein
MGEWGSGVLKNVDLKTPGKKSFMWRMQIRGCWRSRV